MDKLRLTLKEITLCVRGAGDWKGIVHYGLLLQEKRSIRISTTNRIRRSHWKKSTGTSEQKKRRLLSWQCWTIFSFSYLVKTRGTWMGNLNAPAVQPRILYPQTIIRFDLCRTSLIALILFQWRNTKATCDNLSFRNHRSSGVVWCGYNGIRKIEKDYPLQ